MSVKALASRRKVMAEVIDNYPGGRDCVAARLGINLKRLENQMYESAGCKPLDDFQIHCLESETSTTMLPDFISSLYGGVHIPLPEPDEIDNVELAMQQLQEAACRGELFQYLFGAASDGVIDDEEDAGIEARKYAAIKRLVTLVESFRVLHRKRGK